MKYTVKQTYKTKRGLDLPMAGMPDQKEIQNAPAIERVAVLAGDYPGMRPSMRVKEGDAVKRGTPLFEDRKNPGVIFTSPGCGTVEAVNRGERRAFQSVVVKLSADDSSPDANEEAYTAHLDKNPGDYTADEVRALLVESGLWTAFRTRPYSKVPAVDADAVPIFVTATDSNPGAPTAAAVIGAHRADFEAGMQVLAALAGEQTVYLCTSIGDKHDLELPDATEVHAFGGKHPSGTAGFHIHSVLPVNRRRVVWFLGYQDVIAMGALFTSGKQTMDRVISIAGPAAKAPGLFNTRLGVHVPTVVSEQRRDDSFVISGSVFSGQAASDDIFGYLGRYHNQISLIKHDDRRRFLGWMQPGFNTFSVSRLFASVLSPGKQYDFTNDQAGGHRTLVPFGSYDKVMAFDMMPVFLLRSIVSEDLEEAEKLGVLELDEEDLALCTFVCPSKNEYGPALRKVLTRLEMEG